MSKFNTFRQALRRAQFQPTWLGALINPYFIGRSGLLKSLRRFAPEMRGSILDLGCGTKPYEELFSNATSYLGCDVEYSKTFYTDSKVDCVYDGKHLPFADKEFDCIVSFETFEHIFNLDEVMREIHRVTKPSGSLLISIPFGFPEHVEPYDFARYTSFGIQHILKQCGYEIVNVEKTSTCVLAIFQVYIDYLARHLAPRGKLYYLFQVLIIFPSTTLAYLLNSILPKGYEYFNGLVVLARKTPS